MILLVDERILEKKRQSDTKEMHTASTQGQDCSSTNRLRRLKSLQSYHTNKIQQHHAYGTTIKSNMESQDESLSTYLLGLCRSSPQSFVALTRLISCEKIHHGGNVSSALLREGARRMQRGVQPTCDEGPARADVQGGRESRSKGVWNHT